MSCSETSTSSQAEGAHGFAEHDHPGDDRRGAVGVQPDDFAAPGFIHVGEPGEQHFDGAEGERRSR